MAMSLLKGDIQTQETAAQGEHHVKNGVTLPRAKGHQRLVNDQELGEAWNSLPHGSVHGLRSNQSCQWQDLKPLGYRNLRQ